MVHTTDRGRDLQEIHFTLEQLQRKTESDRGRTCGREGCTWLYDSIHGPKYYPNQVAEGQIWRLEGHTVALGASLGFAKYFLRNEFPL